MNQSEMRSAKDRGSRASLQRQAAVSFWSLIALGAPAWADQCDAEFVTQLRTQYNLAQNTVVSQALYEAACNSSSRTNRLGFNASNSEYGNLSFSSDDGGMQKACLTKDYSFFEKNKLNLVYSFLPPEAFAVISDICGGGQLTVSLKSNDSNILIRIAFRNNRGDGRLAKLIHPLQVFPPEAAKCDPLHFKTGLEVIPGGREQACKRLTNTSAYFIIRTDQGDETVGIARTPLIKYTPYLWNYNLSADSANIQCKNQQGTVGTFVPGGMGGTGQAAVERVVGYCSSSYGLGYYEVDNKPQPPLKPRWDFMNPAGSQIDCTADNIKLPSISCVTFGICSAPGDDPVRVTENMRYWCAGHFYSQVQPN